MLGFYYKVNFIMNFILENLKYLQLDKMINPAHHNQPVCKKIDNYIYKFDDLLGQGNFSKVYKGINQITNQAVAIKVIELNSLKSKKLQQLLFSQIEILKKLNHPNVLKCYEVFTSNRNCYIIAELCNGGDLESKLRKVHHFMENQAQPFILDVYKGLRYLYENHIVHRDIKVANIFLHNGSAKIADFGFAKFTNQNFKDINIGSPIYMSPEGFIQNIYGPKTDVWAFGIFIYELLHGQTPFSHCLNQQQLKRQIRTPLSYSHLKPDLSPEIKEVIIKCLQINQERRLSIEQLSETSYFKRLLKSDVQPLKGRRNNYLQTVNSEQNKSLTPNHNNIVYLNLRSDSAQLSADKKKIVKNNLQNEDRNNYNKYHTQERTMKSPYGSNKQIQNKKSNILIQNIGGYSNNYSSPVRDRSPQKNRNGINLQRNFIPNFPKELKYEDKKMKTRIESTPTPSYLGMNIKQSNQTIAVQSNPLNIAGIIITFKEAVNFLHYCRLLYKFIILCRQSGEADKKFLVYLSIVMFNTLTEISSKIDRKQIIYDHENDKKELKLRDVSNQYIKKYSAEIQKPTNRSFPYQAIINEIKNKSQEFQKIYLQKTGSSLFLYLAHFLMVILEATDTMKKCLNEQKLKQWGDYQQMERFLSKNRNSFTYQTFLDMKTKYYSQ